MILVFNNLTERYFSCGIAATGSVGWILKDTLNSYFVLLDSNTRYIGDKLENTTITYKDKGYMLCWIPKDNVELLLNNGIAGTYEDFSTGEYLRFFETKNGINISYFTNKKFENTLRLVSFNKNENKVIVKFNGSEQTYQLEFKNNFKSLECKNPDLTKQYFNKR